MTKPKSQFQPDTHYPIEFISPYSLEECVARLPQELLQKIDQDCYELKIGAGDTHANIKIRGYLIRDRVTATTVRAKAKIPFTEHLWPLGVFIFVYLMSQILFDSPYPAQIAVVIVTIIGIFVLRRLNSETQRRAEKVLSILQSVPKRKVGENKFPRLFFSHKFEYRSSFTPEFCRVRFQRTILGQRRFRQATNSVEFFALNENLFEFHIIQPPNLKLTSLDNWNNGKVIQRAS